MKRRIGGAEFRATPLIGGLHPSGHHRGNEMDHNAAIIGPAYHKLSARPRGNIHRLIGRQIDERETHVTSMKKRGVRA